MRKIYFFGTGLVLLGLTGWILYVINKPHRNAAALRPAATLSAEELYTDFTKSESSANEKWVGKVIEIKGTISSVSDAGNYVSINLRATETGGINCSIQKKDMNSVDKYQSGDNITIKGKCTGMLMDVNLVDCVILK
jgi:hypothetical protein